jgi:hypothetical protein
MRALINYSHRKHEWPNRLTIEAATTETIGGVRTRTPSVVVVSDDLAAEMQAHDVMRAWFGPFGIVVAPVIELVVAG